MNTLKNHNHVIQRNLMRLKNLQYAYIAKGDKGVFKRIKRIANSLYLGVI